MKMIQFKEECKGIELYTHGKYLKMLHQIVELMKLINHIYQGKEDD